MKTVKIMRGIPGSGKSTYADELFAKALKDKIQCGLVSADFYFTDRDTGDYHFNADQLGDAHKTCMSQFLALVHDKYPIETVIVDNTNINIEDIAPYIAVGEALDYDVEIIQVDTDPEVAAARNVHGVSRAKVLDMHRRLTSLSLPRRWKLTRITQEK